MTISTQRVEEESLQLAENLLIDEQTLPTDEERKRFYENKRDLLDKTKISKQTWSIIEIYRKIKDKKLILSPDYQRNFIWDLSKRTSFIESLYMGIVIPPVYVVEIPAQETLEETRYEVVDGKQRLSTLLDFLDNKLTLQSKSLEYFEDWFGNKSFHDINNFDSEKTTEMLSSVLDIYVITANSPEFTKYDIFSRLNKGSEPLKVNEIRRAVYKSPVLDVVDNYIKDNYEKDFYKEYFSKNDINRYEDYGRFFRSIAYYTNFDAENKIINDYKSRPRDMINNVLASFQIPNNEMEESEVMNIIKTTLELDKSFRDTNQKDYYIDVCIYFAVTDPHKFAEKLDTIKSDTIISGTFTKSPSTTSNVNLRVSRISEIMNEE